MKKKPLVHLHLHTCYSLLDGACQIDPLIDAAVEEEMPAVAMTDHGVMYGAVEFYKAAREKNIKPVIGCEVYITTGSRFSRGEDARHDKTHHLVLLAATTAGYYNLIKLVSAGHLEGFYYKPRIDHELLARYSGGLIALSSCLKGEVAGRLVENDMDGAVSVAGRYADILGKDNVFLEIMDHGLSEQRRVMAGMPELSRRTGLPIVATNDVHYLKQAHAHAHEVLLCMQTGTVLSDSKRMRYATDQFYLKSRAEMDPLFREFPGALDITTDIATRCNVEFDFNSLRFPTYEVPAEMNQKAYLRKVALDGLCKHYRIADPSNPRDDGERRVLDRFDQELHIISKAGFVNYFLVVWDFMRFAREQKIPVGPGRGSGGGSIVAYALGITAIDPLHYDLIFERFLNLERVSPPDFDIDFCMDRRGEVIDYVKRRYGSENVAQIITFGSLGAKSVIRDVGRVLEIPFGTCDRLSKMIPEDPKMTLKKALEQSPDFKRAYESDEDCKRILDYGFVLEGLYRNPGVHAAGVVIGDKPLDEIVPLSCDKDKQPVTQFAKSAVEEIGLLKMDFLGLKTLTVLDEAVKTVKRLHGIELDLENLPLDDKATFALLSRGDTVGVFQLESSGMRDLIRRISMNCIEDLIAMIALYRPGPMNMLPDFVDRKCGKTKIVYDHPLLEPILKETYGVMVYQEQVQRAANVLAGYSLGDADILRRAMGKKNPQVMQDQRAKFVDGCRTLHDIPAKLAGSIFDNMEKFAGYGFNKSHSAGYAIIAYQTAYMKANHPAEFMSAVLSGEIGNFDKIPVFVAEAQAMGLQILAPDVNNSEPRFQPEGPGIRFGLAGIKNVGAGAADAIVRERKANGRFRSLVEFCSRVDSQSSNKKVIESLIRCGGFDSFNVHRARLFNGIDFAMSRAMSTLRDQQNGQGSLFGLLDEKTDGLGRTDDDLPDCPPWHENELLAGERELLGMYITGHPLTQYSWLINKYQMTGVEGLNQLDDHTDTRVGGIVSKINKRLTKASKEMMAIMTLEDLDGSVEVVVFSEPYQRCAANIEEDGAVLVCGYVQKKEEKTNLIAQEVHRLVDAPKYFTQRLSVHIPVALLTDERLETLREILRLHPGLVPVTLVLQFPSEEKVFIRTDPSFQVLPTQDLIQEIEKEFGETSVYVALNPDVYARPSSKPRQRPPNNGNVR